MAVTCNYGGEPSGSGATELVQNPFMIHPESYNFICLLS
jgi:hypothetical protein